MLVRLLMALLRIVGAEQLSYPVRQLSRGSLRILLKRTRRLAAAMADAFTLPRNTRLTPIPCRVSPSSFKSKPLTSTT